MAGIIEQCDVGALHLASEILHGGVEGRLVEIELGASADQGEAETGERIRHQRGVVGGILEPADVLIGGIADHQAIRFSGAAAAAGETDSSASHGINVRSAPRIPPSSVANFRPPHPEMIPQIIAAHYQPPAASKSAGYWPGQHDP